MRSCLRPRVPAPGAAAAAEERALLPRRAVAVAVAAAASSGNAASAARSLPEPPQNPEIYKRCGRQRFATEASPAGSADAAGRVGTAHEQQQAALLVAQIASEKAWSATAAARATGTRPPRRRRPAVAQAAADRRRGEMGGAVPHSMHACRAVPCSVMPSPAVPCRICLAILCQAAYGILTNSCEAGEAHWARPTVLFMALLQPKPRAKTIIRGAVRERNAHEDDANDPITERNLPGQHLRTKLQGQSEQHAVLGWGAPTCMMVRIYCSCYTGFSRCNNFRIFCPHATIIAMSTIAPFIGA
eukprot:317066-Chlamydomonas_euryale.AAC.4